MNSPEPRDSTSLRIHARRVVSATGEMSQEAVVECPRQAAAIDFDECASCAVYDGLTLDHARGRSFVVCHAPRPELAAPPPRSALVAELMTSDVVCVRDDLDLDSLRELFLREDVRSAPVVDATRAPIGIISRSDLLGEGPADTVVADLMTPMSFFVHARTTVTHAAALMAYEGVHQVHSAAEAQAPQLVQSSVILFAISSLRGSGWSRSVRSAKMESTGLNPLDLRGDARCAPASGPEKMRISGGLGESASRTVQMGRAAGARPVANSQEMRGLALSRMSQPSPGWGGALRVEPAARALLRRRHRRGPSRAKGRARCCRR